MGPVHGPKTVPNFIRLPSPKVLSSLDAMTTALLDLGCERGRRR